MKKRRIGISIFVGVLATSIIALSGCASVQNSKSESSKKESSIALSSNEETSERKISQSEAESKAQTEFRYMGKYHLQDSLKGIARIDKSKKYSISNIVVASTDVSDHSFEKDYTVILKGTFSVYDEYGRYQGNYTFDAIYEVSYDGDERFVSCTAKW